MNNKTQTRDENRIRKNLNAYLEALSHYNHFSWKAENAKLLMDRSLSDLRAAGGHEEAEKYAKTN